MSRRIKRGRIPHRSPGVALTQNAGRTQRRARIARHHPDGRPSGRTVQAGRVVAGGCDVALSITIHERGDARRGGARRDAVPVGSGGACDLAEIVQGHALGDGAETVLVRCGAAGWGRVGRGDGAVVCKRYPGVGEAGDGDVGHGDLIAGEGCVVYRAGYFLMERVGSLGNLGLYAGSRAWGNGAERVAVSHFLFGAASPGLAGTGLPG